MAISLFGRRKSCSHCGDTDCRGECLQNTQLLGQSLAQQQQQLQMLKDQYLFNNKSIPYGNILTGIGSIYLYETVATKQPQLPEEKVLCATGGIVGWRLWRVPCFGETLLSINGREWKPREALKSNCNKGAAQCRGVNCECGVYAWKQRGDVEVNASAYNCIKGEVWLWGKIVEHAKGYRAQFAYPKAFEPSADAERVARIYGVKLL